MIKKKLTLAEAKKFLKTKGLFLNIRKNNQKQNLGSNNLSVFSKTFISSILLISFFAAMPIVSNFKEERKLLSKEFKNNSKNDFKNTLNGKDPKINENEDVLGKYLFDDIFSYDDLPSDTVRLSANTIKQLFEDTKYSLRDVRKTKLVKPVSLSLLPNEMKMIESTKKRKELFIQIILPLIIKENNIIRSDRKKLFKILNKKSYNSENEKRWLKKKFKQYGVAKKDISTLKVRMDVIPTSIAIAQAAKETGWGTSRFALEGNALFGQWTWSGEGIRPAGADDNTKHKVMKFKVLQASVKAYHRNLNTHSSYRAFRSVRAELRDADEELDSLILSEYLDQYAETGKEYVKILQQIIRQNELTDFDDAKLLPSTISLESLI